MTGLCGEQDNDELWRRPRADVSMLGLPRWEEHAFIPHTESHTVALLASFFIFLLLRLLLSTSHCSPYGPASMRFFFLVVCLFNGAAISAAGLSLLLPFSVFLGSV
jgi:hypothetical protein